ncbi:unnamed protein product [Pedinophyceae sp. YPF-701]|nr:unnamed protein product [Pedinophyceae sp. YPF-701]
MAGPNVPVDELEEMLVVALRRVERFVSTCDAGAGLALVATRVEAEFAARTRDIQATSTFVHRMSHAHLDAFCREISVPGRQLRTRPSQDDTYPCGLGVAATLEKPEGGNWEAVDVMHTIMIADAAADSDCQSNKDQMAVLMGEAQRGTLTYAFAEKTKVRHAGRAWNVTLGAYWTPQRPEILWLDPDTLTADPKGRRAGRREDVGAFVAEIVQGLRSPKVARKLWATSLVPPSANGVAQGLQGVDQDWDAAGRFPAVTLTILQGNTVESRSPRALLTLPDGMQWQLAANSPHGARAPFAIVGEIFDSDLFCRSAPAALPWRAVADKFAEQRELLSNCSAATVKREALGDGPEQLIMYIYAAALGQPNAMAAAQAKFDRLFDMIRQKAPHGPSCGCKNCVFANQGIAEWKRANAVVLDSPSAYNTRGGVLYGAGASPGDRGRFVCVSTRKAAAAFETNAPQDEVEEMLAVALRRVCAVMAQPSAQGFESVVLTQIASECFSRSRDLQATSTLLTTTGLPGASAFCSAIDADGRGLHADHSQGIEDCRFRVPLEVDGGESWTLDCTSFVDADREPGRKALLAAVGATKSATVHPRVYTCLREVVEVEDGPGNIGKAVVQVTGSFVKDVPDKIFLAAPRKRMSGSDASKPRKLARFQLGDFRSPDFFAKLIVRALRRPGALRAISAGALLAPLSAVDVSAHAREEAWGPNGEFPAVSVNIAMVFSPIGPHPLVWLGLPRGMRWRVAGRGDTGLTQLTAEVASKADVVLEHSLSFGTTWDAIARATFDLEDRVVRLVAITTPGQQYGARERDTVRSGLQGMLDHCAVQRAFDATPFDRAEEYRVIRSAAREPT